MVAKKVDRQGGEARTEQLPWKTTDFTHLATRESDYERTTSLNTDIKTITNKSEVTKERLHICVRN